MKRPRKPRKPALAKIVGKAEDWSDADIERMATITREDIQCAKAHARRLAPKRLRRLLEGRGTKETQRGDL